MRSTVPLKPQSANGWAPTLTAILVFVLLATSAGASPGSLDPSFDGDGMLIARFFNGSDQGNAIALQQDGKIVVVGSVSNSNNDDFGLLRLNADGSPDLSFGTDGIVQDDISGDSDGANAVAIQPDGKVVVAGFTTVDGTLPLHQFAVVRYNTDGSRDTSFGTSGVVTTQFSDDQPYKSTANAIALQPDGKIIVAGDRIYSGDSDFALARYNSDGSLDTSFSGDGKLFTSFTFSHDMAFAAALQGDGKILVAGFANVNYQRDFALARYTSNGTLDTTFDSDGKVTTAVTTINDEAHALAIQPDGKIVVAGYAAATANSNNFALLRYQTNGTLDTTFGATGIVITSVGSGSSNAYGVRLQGDGRIVVAGNSGADIAVTRYTVAGSLDTDFDGDGIAITQASFEAGRAARAYGVALQTDGKIVTAGYAYYAYDGHHFSDDFAVVRYTATGSLDMDFDGNGIVRLQIGRSDQVCSALAMQSDGKIVAAGFVRDGTDKLILARYRVDGSLDTDFNTWGYRIWNYTSNTSALDVAIQPDGKIVAVGYSGYGGKDNILVARFNPNGALDNTFSTYGYRSIPIGSGVDVATAVAIQPDGKIVLAGYTSNGLDLDIFLLRLLSNGASDTSFGSGGVITAAFGSGDDRAEGMALQPDGKIVLAGQASDGANTDFVLLRFNADGTPDLTFGMDGKVLVDFGSANAEAYEVTIQPDGRIIAAGYYHDYNPAMLQFAVARLEANGTLDTTFGNDGMALVDTGGITGYSMGMALQADGRIVVAGVADNLTAGSFALARINPDGTPDTTFGDGGRLTTSFDGDFSAAHAVAIQPDGKIVAGGYSVSAGFYDVALARYDAGAPLAVDLASFEATAAHGAVRLTWETASELDNLGFNLWRNTSPDGPTEQINTNLIPSQAPGSAQGFTYTWEDGDVEAGLTYWYWLEDIDLNGTTTLHGPVSATVETPTAVTLSDLRISNQPTKIWPGWVDPLVKALHELLTPVLSR